MRYILLLMIVISSCGGPEIETCMVDTSDPRTFSHVDAEFAPYVSDFESHYGNPIDIPMGFKKLDRPTVGVCYRWSSGYREIAVDPDWWEKAEPASRQELLFHELGHCVLNRQHSREVDKNKLPLSIMWPTVFSGYLLDNYEINFDRYIEELFADSKVK